MPLPIQNTAFHQFIQQAGSNYCREKSAISISQWTWLLTAPGSDSSSGDARIPLTVILLAAVLLWCYSLRERERERGGRGSEREGGRERDRDTERQTETD